MKKPSLILNKLKNQKNMILIGVFALLFAYYFIALSPTPRNTPQKLDIFAIEEPLKFGEATLSGTLRTDKTSTNLGNYYLVLPNDLVIIIDNSKEIISSSMIGNRVTIVGELVDLSDLSIAPLLIPTSIVTN